MHHAYNMVVHVRLKHHKNSCEPDDQSGQEFVSIFAKSFKKSFLFFLSRLLFRFIIFWLFFFLFNHLFIDLFLVLEGKIFCKSFSKPQFFIFCSKKSSHFEIGALTKNLGKKHGQNEQWVVYILFSNNSQSHMPSFCETKQYLTDVYPWWPICVIFVDVILDKQYSSQHRV